MSTEMTFRMRFLTIVRSVADDTRNFAHRATGHREAIESAWRTLELVHAQIRHAETKAITTLAAAGVLGQVLFSVVRAGREPHHVVLATSAAICTFLVITAALFAICVLWPRLSPPAASIGPLHDGQTTGAVSLGRDGYTEALVALSRDPERIVDNLAAQVWENARVARRKYRYANLAVGNLLAAVFTLGATVALAAHPGLEP
ncbi:hypothetical protein GV794_19555 [Nocardia cyriacigeorgica]|uniref:Pycsar effector protein domain-containing protein n=1 Tax=Nocardia cyriacigeorgica TaxID=135487 RepID=A0A6P1D5C2_9NOCA|nr:Pycsar system effector family protein [Nocardia cyriacigeorgica]NEW41406.1 hypothetical protein [Nocardia cyriacigeorgica]NEW44749.1 hypothetical protein [Nocardia cyriacigeorgica]NEW50849.1 hypothetical protein [Nocardia cyriacigeorgica]NEW57835.1 hypothetical protein [Nocardia cyriacigeorgica]